MEKTKTNRGFDLIKSVDLYGIKFSIQKSSLATEDAIWFGIDDVKPEIMAKDAPKFNLDNGNGTGWVDYPLPKEVLLHARMHLTREMVEKIIPILQNFVKTGKIN